MRFAGLAVPVLLLVASGCCTNRTTTFHRGATAEAPQLPARVGAPLRKGEIQLAGTVNPVLLKGVTTFPLKDNSAPAMWIPRTQLGGMLYWGTGHRGEIGLQFQGSSARWTSPTTEGIVKAGDKETRIMQGGMGIRFNPVPRTCPFQVSGLMEFNLVHRDSVVEKHTICTEWNCSFVDDPAPVEHDSVLAGKTTGANFAAGVNISWEVVSHLHLLGVGIMSFHGSNRYSDTTTHDPTREAGPDTDPWMTTRVFHLGAGLEFRRWPFVLNALVHYPLTGRDGLEYGPALSATIGFFAGGDSL